MLLNPDNDALFLKQANFRNRATASGSFATTVKQHDFTGHCHGDRRQAPLDRGRLDDDVLVIA